MKKLSFLLIVLISSFSFAQVTFKLGIRGGANFSHFTQGSGVQNYLYYNNDTHSYEEIKAPYKFTNRTDFYLGIFGNIRLGKSYALQPELIYSGQGSKVENSGRYDRDEYKISYLGTQLVNKFYFKKLNVLIGPTIDLAMSKDFDSSYEFDLGITAGLGYDITENFGVEARIKHGFLHTINNYQGKHANVVFQTGIYYSINMKKQKL